MMDRIFFDPVFTKAMVQGKIISEFGRRAEGAAPANKLLESMTRHLGV